MVDASLEYLDDLEIYVASTDLEAIQAWLSSEFEQFESYKPSKKGFKFQCSYHQKTSQGLVHLNAGNTGFTSIWVDSKAAPWHNDVEMARAAYATLKTTVRCNESAWSKGDDPDRWLEINAEGEQIIQWVTQDHD